MSDDLSVLPTELIEKIFDHISIVDILSPVCLVNRRLYSISRVYSRFRLDCNSIAKKKKQFDFLCNHLSNLAARIISLAFDDNDNRITNAKILRFFCSITMNDIFLNLHSITLNKIDWNIWNSIRTRLPTFTALRSMSINSVDDSKASTSALMSLIFHDLLFTVRSLKHLFLNTSFCWTETITISSSSSIQISAIECLTVTGIQINLHQLFAVAPMLCQLKVELIVSQLFHVDMIFEPSFNLQQLSIKTSRVTMLEIKRLLLPMTCLTHLTLHICEVGSDLINGHAWIPLLIKIIVFQFVFEISSEDDVDLDSFRSRFWLEEKKWYVTFDQWIDTSCSFVYTNPCSTDHCYPLPFMKTKLVTKSTGLEPTTLPNAKYLFFDGHSPMQKAHLQRFTHVRTLNMKGALGISLEYIIRCIDLSRITSFTQGESKIEESSNEFVRILHSLPHLRSLCLNISTLIMIFDRHWPQIIDLNMKSDFFYSSTRLSSIEIDALWRSFTHLQRLAFDRQSVRNLSRLFNNMTMTLSYVWIRHYGNLNDCHPQLITRQWLEQNTNMRHFDYFHDNDWDVYLWL